MGSPVTAPALVAIDPDRMLVAVDGGQPERVQGFSVGAGHVRVQYVGDAPGPWRRYDGASVRRAILYPTAGGPA